MLAFTSLPSKVDKFNSFFGLVVVGLEKAISSILRKIIARKNHGFKI